MSKHNIKGNIQKAVEDGGYIDLRRIGKANSQLEYHNGQVKFNGKVQNENLDEDLESEEYKQMMQKQREIDYKSDIIVSSSMKIFKDYTQSQSSNVEQKVRELKQKNKRKTEERRNQADQIDLISIDKELKKKEFIFPPLERNKVKEDATQKLYPRINTKDDEDSLSHGNQSEKSKQQNANAFNQNQEQNSKSQQQSEKYDKQKFDFHVINNKNQQKKRENITTKQIGNLPRDIQSISEWQDDSVVQQQNVLEKLERSKVDIFQGDLIESFSVAYIQPNHYSVTTTHNICFFRDLAPVSRFLVKYTNMNLTAEQRLVNKNSEEYSNSELIQADEIIFDVNKLTFSNLADIISGRMGDDQLVKFDNSPQNIQDLPSDIQKRVEELVQLKLDQQLKTLQLSQLSMNQQQQQSQQQQQTEQKKKQTQQTQSDSPTTPGPSKEQIKNSFKQKSSQDQQIQIDQPINHSPRMGLNKNEKDMTPEQKKMHQQIVNLHNQTDQILNKIGEIKAKKEDMKYIRDQTEYFQKYKEVKKELQQALSGLLFMILRTDNNPNPAVNMKQYELDDLVSQLLSNIDKIQGQRTTEGHLKTGLLLTFLEEYKWITQEDKLHKMDFDSSNKQPQNKPNTFPNYLHAGQTHKQAQKGSTNTSFSHSPMTSYRQHDAGNFNQANNAANNSNFLSPNHVPANPKNAKPITNAQAKYNAKENISNQQNSSFNKGNNQNRSNTSSRANNTLSHSPHYKQSGMNGLETTTSYYQQTPVKRQNANSSMMDRSHTPGSAFNKSSTQGMNQSFNKSQSALSNKRSVSPINNKMSTNNNHNRSNTSFNQSSVQKMNTSRSRSPMNTKNGSSLLESKSSNSFSLKKNGLSDMKIPGVQKGMISQLNKSYQVKDSSFTYDDSRPSTYRKY